jgi:sulfite exporter TauE/SafE
MNDGMVLQGISLFTVWMLGLSMGLTACTVTCLPFMGTWIVGRGVGASAAMRDTVGFMAGRVAAYGLLGGLAGGAGLWLAETLKGGVGHVLIGVAAIAAGVWLFIGRDNHPPCGVRKKLQGAPPLAIGFALSFTPCVPLASLLATSAQANSMVTGMGYGLAFGIGAAVTPMLIILPLLGKFGQNLRNGRPWIGQWAKYGAAMVLIAIGVRRLFLIF